MLLQLLRLMAGASPELAGFAFMCDGVIEATHADVPCAPVEPSTRVPIGYAPATVQIVRLPLFPQQ